jgi:hypothetical protein
LTAEQQIFRTRARLQQGAVVKSIANQSFAELSGPMSVLSLQKRDHIELGRLLQQLSVAPVSGQAGVLIEIYRLVFPHAFAEEAVLWPVIRRVLPDGERLTLQVEVEHQQINQLVRTLEGREPGSAEHRQLLDRIVMLFHQDVGDEENELLPRLQMALSARQLWLLGFAWEAVRRIAPTRPHPIVSRRPPGNVLSALPLSVLDRSRDALERMAIRRGAPASSTLNRISSGLARATLAIEQLPGMKRGERPQTRAERQPRRGPRAAAAVSVVAVLATGWAIAASRRKPLTPGSAASPGSGSPAGPVPA